MSANGSSGLIASSTIAISRLAGRSSATHRSTGSSTSCQTVTARMKPEQPLAVKARHDQRPGPESVSRAKLLRFVELALDEAA
jgi:hypothetical protein